MDLNVFQTSAPSVVHVDEFHDELSTAERRKREEAERQRLNSMPNKQRFFMSFNKKVRNISCRHSYWHLYTTF